MCCKHIGNKYVRIHNACKAHPTTSKLLDDLYVGHEIKAEASIGFGNSGTEDTQRFQLLDKFKRIGIAMFEFMGNRNDFAINKTPDFGDDHLPFRVESGIHKQNLVLVYARLKLLTVRASARRKPWDFQSQW